VNPNTTYSEYVAFPFTALPGTMVLVLQEWEDCSDLVQSVLLGVQY
jgi:hypothetical protein